MGGLAAALHLRAAGCDVTILEQHGSPGGRHGSLEIDGFRFDTGPPLPLVPASLTALLHVVGERLEDWIELLPLDPVCRAHFTDGGIRDLPPGPGHHQRRAPWTAVESLFGMPPGTYGWYPSGGTGAVGRMLASVAEKHGIFIGYQSKLIECEKRGDHVSAARTDCGETLPADALVLPPARASRDHRCLVVHLGATAAYSKIAHHNVHFGVARDEPAILVSSPSRTDPTAAPPGRHVFRVAVPMPGALGRDGVLAHRYAGEIMATLEARGYLDLGGSLRVSYVEVPSDWVRQEMPGAIPEIATKRPGRLHPALANVVIAGPGLESGRQTAELARHVAESTSMKGRTR